MTINRPLVYVSFVCVYEALLNSNKSKASSMTHAVSVSLALTTQTDSLAKLTRLTTIMKKRHTNGFGDSDSDNGALSERSWKLCRFAIVRRLCAPAEIIMSICSRRARYKVFVCVLNGKFCNAGEKRLGIGMLLNRTRAESGASPICGLERAETSAASQISGWQSQISQ